MDLSNFATSLNFPAREYPRSLDFSPLSTAHFSSRSMVASRDRDPVHEGCRVTKWMAHLKDPREKNGEEVDGMAAAFHRTAGVHL